MLRSLVGSEICIRDSIIGQGTHDELLHSCPMYRQLCLLQLGGEAV